MSLLIFRKMPLQFIDFSKNATPLGCNIFQRMKIAVAIFEFAKLAVAYVRLIIFSDAKVAATRGRDWHWIFQVGRVIGPASNLKEVELHT